MFNRANPQPPNPPINVPYLFLYDPATNTMQPFCPLQEYTDSSQGSKKYYSHTDKRKREQLVRLVEEQGLSIKEASDSLGINYSTAKAIVKENKKFLQERSTKSDDEYLPGNNVIENKFKDEHIIKGPRCIYQEINTEIEDKEAQRKPKIQIISTVAWDFLSNGLQ